MKQYYLLTNSNLYKMQNYGIDIWGDDNFIIEEGVVKVNYNNKPSLVSIVKKFRKSNNHGPLLLRFPHITQKQIDRIYDSFNLSISEYNYNGNFEAVFPLKVNQLPNFILPMLKSSEHLKYGLEAGSKAELLIAMAYNNRNSKITVNGFKDKDMITLGFLAKQKGHDITLTLEGINELKTIIEVIEETNLIPPNIGLRVRLHSSGNGKWSKSGGINSKFGLSATEILEAYDILKKYKLLKYFVMIHFHIGSSMNQISPFKKALNESGHIYAQLKNMGAFALNTINIGGGLSVEYSQFENTKEYSLMEFTNDVVFILQSIATNKNVPQPNILMESGRFIAAHSCVLITPVLELFSSEYEESSLRKKNDNPDIIKELYNLYENINTKNAIEYMHDALDHLESILTLFDLGYVDLQDKSNAEILTHLIIKKSIALLDSNSHTQLKKFEHRIQEKYLLNFSIFQSLPDFWGIEQNFPMMPITHLDKIASRSATLWDITCDSDGEIPFNSNNPLYLHEVDLNDEEYFIGFFLTGAYQDILGMKHNLFSSPSEISIIFDENNGYKVKNLLKSQRILDILDDLDFDIKDFKKKLFSSINDLKSIDLLKNYLDDNSYLKT